MSQNLSSAAAVIGALRVKLLQLFCFAERSNLLVLVEGFIIVFNYLSFGK